MTGVNPRAAWWAQSLGFAPTVDGVNAAMARHGSWTFMAFISRCAAAAEAAGFRPASDHPRFDEVVRSQAMADTLRRFPA